MGRKRIFTEVHLWAHLDCGDRCKYSIYSENMFSGTLYLQQCFFNGLNIQSIEKLLKINLSKLDF